MHGFIVFEILNEAEGIVVEKMNDRLLEYVDIQNGILKSILLERKFMGF